MFANTPCVSPVALFWWQEQQRRKYQKPRCYHRNRRSSKKHLPESKTPYKATNTPSRSHSLVSLSNPTQLCSTFHSTRPSTVPRFPQMYSLPPQFRRWSMPGIQKQRKYQHGGWFRGDCRWRRIKHQIGRCRRWGIGCGWCGFGTGLWYRGHI